MDLAWLNADVAQIDPTTPVAHPPSRPLVSALRVIGYFGLFFGAMALGGVLFTFGGIGLILIPGSLPQWFEVGYIVVGILGSVGIALLVTNGIFRLRGGGATPGSPVSRRRRVLGWFAGLLGTVIASALIAVVRSMVEQLVQL